MFHLVTTDKDLDEVVTVARIIWTEHYTSIIGIEQVEYMLEKFNSKQVIAEQIADDNYQYYLVKNKGEIVGYIGVQLKASELFLSKIYIQSAERGLGLGKLSMAFIKKVAEENNLSKITLTVNKNNRDTIAAYYKFGFTNTGEVCADIGEGYVMDDLQMELQLSE
ncbi:GNAT family N-acetyltransferase [Thalassotalea psychrophila]|uniref:GNAT family N-acetyltransferase n=1 Tax=Thalassotalea psychrophila TaxID=3065647 RepID=A0ABY9TSE0_9GAMM|nr:GNAT family N-acetyltransferase [Colwelliaceae bacterium SQ149]